ncbi:helix-turn-helix domain-containing protein [Flagellimonas sp.]|uniref:helix-turn-helix domain-containing protein n=1 Tax=Flagellimonas sp. TaxID=2058762 RepID=UPI003BACEAE1
MNKKHHNPVLYAYSADDLENLVNLVIQKVRKTELIGDLNFSPEEDRLTQNEACSLLGISTQTLIRWKKKNIVPYYQIGRSIFYSKKELLALAQNNKGLIKLPRD